MGAKRKWWSTCAWATVLLALLYVLSIGPVCRYRQWCLIESDFEEFAYTPLFRLAEVSPLFDKALAAYIGWWTQRD